jgi:hypothetical protein
VRPTWILRGARWRAFHLASCLKCGRMFADDEPGCALAEDLRFPELCRTPGGPYAKHSGVCEGRGPYCPRCAVPIAAELEENRRLYEGW